MTNPSTAHLKPSSKKIEIAEAAAATGTPTSEHRAMGRNETYAIVPMSGATVEGGARERFTQSEKLPRRKNAGCNQLGDGIRPGSCTPEMGTRGRAKTDSQRAESLV
jgi:hypothetical protein